MRNRLEGEPMDILHLGGGGEGQHHIGWQHWTPGFRIQEWSKDPGEQEICGYQPTKLCCLQEGLSPGCSPDVLSCYSELSCQNFIWLSLMPSKTAKLLGGALGRK